MKHRLKNMLSIIKQGWKGLINTFKYEWKGLLKTFVVGVVFYIALCLFHYSVFVNILTFFLGNLVIDHKATEKIRILKIKQELDLGKKFNRDYFDLYWDTTLSWIRILFNSQITLLTISNAFIGKIKIDFFIGILYNSVISLLGIILWAIYLSYSNKERILRVLMIKRKAEWEGDYTSEQIEILELLVKDKHS